MQKILWNFQPLTDDLISARRPDQVIVNQNKTSRRIVDLAVNNRVELKESKKRDKNLELAEQL